MPTDGQSLAYIILAHKLPDQLARLVRRLHHPQDLVLVHIDAKSDQAPFEQALADLTGPNVRLCRQRFAIHWGGFGEVRAARSALGLAFELGHWSHAVLLSGQDYPIKSQSEIRGFLAAHADASFMFSSASRDPWPADGRQGNDTWYWDGNLLRLRLRYYRVGRYLVPLPGWWHWGIPGLARIPGGLRLRQGSAWWAMHRPAAQWVLDYGDRRPEVQRFFSRALIPAENYFQMLFDASPFRDQLVQDDLHFQCWDRWHPRVLSEADLGPLLASHKLFARKFDADQHPGVLDELDRHHSAPAESSGPAR
ncbi:MAG TPA: beta-1,6-N-acetylglucosaminyltransferase [Streptosporangiaceae bacterium]|nr:beta-1,6-N-acetylglucosaminyltransferase [Streptosporangiaceae bacterium]